MKAVRIPHDQQQPIEIIEINKNFEALAEAIGDGCEYVEEVKCKLTPEHDLVMVVDEDGLMHQQRHNVRAQWLYPFSPIVGTALVCQSGWVVDGRDFVDLDDPNEALALVLQEVGA